MRSRGCRSHRSVADELTFDAFSRRAGRGRIHFHALLWKRLAAARFSQIQPVMAGKILKDRKHMLARAWRATAAASSEEASAAAAAQTLKDDDDDDDVSVPELSFPNEDESDSDVDSFCSKL